MHDFRYHFQLVCEQDVLQSAFGKEAQFHPELGAEYRTNELEDVLKSTGKTREDFPGRELMVVPTQDIGVCVSQEGSYSVFPRGGRGSIGVAELRPERSSVIVDRFCVISVPKLENWEYSAGSETKC